MTPIESGLTFWAVIGLAGCAAALVALVRDWREQMRPHVWRMHFGDEPIDPAATSWTTTSDTLAAAQDAQERRFGISKEPRA